MGIINLFLKITWVPNTLPPSPLPFQNQLKLMPTEP